MCRVCFWRHPVFWFKHRLHLIFLRLVVAQVWFPIYMIRWANDRDPYRWVCFVTSAHLILIGVFRIRILLRRDGPEWWRMFFGLYPFWQRPWFRIKKARQP